MNPRSPAGIQPGMTIRTLVETWAAAGAALAALSVAAFGGGGSGVKEPEGFALVELFTSEGCSSCPPADGVLSRVGREASAGGAGPRVYALAFHVDYWDNLGWKDRFSSREFTDRQRGYGKHFRLRSIYTPQMVVNGGEEFVGSDETRARDAVRDALARPAAVRVEATAVAGENGAVRVAVRAAGAPADGKAWVAVAENGLVTRVERGENGGRELRHDHVVRGFASAAVGAKGEAEVVVMLPPDVKRERCEVVVWVTASDKPAVLGAVKTGLDARNAP